MTDMLKKLSTVKLTRLEFFGYVGAIFIGILGIPSFLRLVTDINPRAKAKKLDRSATKPEPHTFGSGPYGV